MADGYINAYHHRSAHAGEFSFNDGWNGSVHPTRDAADRAAAFELKVEPLTRRVGIWRVKAKD